MSAGSAHPSPTLTVAAAPLNVGPGSVGTGPVGVYVGSVAADPPVLSTGGGHASAAMVAVGICPALAPPVCHDCRGGCHGLVPPQDPTAWRGSFGIHPLSRPSWYDQAGDSTVPVTDELPIFQVQKNQF